MEKEILKAKIDSLLHSRKIVLFGVSILTDNFYNDYKNEINIVCCVSNNSSEWGEKKVCGELDVVPFDSSMLSRDYYIIMCVYNSTKTVFRQLTSNGLEMFLDFNDQRIVRGILSHKKIAVFRGACLIENVQKCLVNVNAFDKEYSAVFIRDENKDNKYENPLLLYAVKVCDLYLFAYRPMVNNIFLINDKELPDDCIKVSVSNHLFPGYFPQMNGLIDYDNANFICSYEDSKIRRIFLHDTYLYVDKYLDKLILEGYSTEEIEEKVSGDEFLTEKDVQKHVTKTKLMLSLAEKTADIKMLDYFLDNYINRIIYHNQSHPENCVLWEYTRRILVHINIDDSECNEIEENETQRIHHGGDIPIYPSIIKHLGLKWIESDNEYTIGCIDGMHKMSFREYVRRYVEYGKKAREIISSW